jgi:hypothetical protein
MGHKLNKQLSIRTDLTKITARKTCSLKAFCYMGQPFSVPLREIAKRTELTRCDRMEFLYRHRSPVSTEREHLSLHIDFIVYIARRIFQYWHELVEKSQDKLSSCSRVTLWQAITSFSLGAS